MLKDYGGKETCNLIQVDGYYLNEMWSTKIDTLVQNNFRATGKGSSWFCKSSAALGWIRIMTPTDDLKAGY
jgi:hypothetical protein